MLRISEIGRTAHRVTLKVEGRIDAEGVDLVEWSCARARVRGKVPRLDVTGVTWIDRRGVELLRRLADTGIELDGCRPILCDPVRSDGAR